MAARSAKSNLRAVIAVLIVGTPLAGLSFLAVSFIPLSRLVRDPFVCGLIRGVLLWVPLIPFVFLCARWAQRPAVRDLLRARGRDICTRCGYSLRGLDGTIDRCPECGAKRKPMPEEAA